MLNIRFSKAISAVSAAAVIAAAITILPGASDEVAASAPILNAGKADRLDLRPTGKDCSQQAWPHYEAGCVRNNRQAFGKASPVRVVSADRNAVR